jgi:phage gpG-like protein
MITSNADDVAESTIGRAEAVAQEYEEQLEQTLNEAQSRASRDVPVDTGALRNDISIDRGDRWARIFNTLHYAPFINFGTEGPYIIEADEADALRFEVDGEEVFAQAVLHPGIEATYYMTDAALDAFIDSVDRIEAWD